MPNIIQQLRDTYSENPAKALEMLPELFKATDDGKIVEISDKRLETLKLLTIATICYQYWHDTIMKKIKDSVDIRELFFHLPTVQYFANDMKLERLLKSEIDVNKIESIDEIVNIIEPRELEGQKK